MPHGKVLDQRILVAAFVACLAAWVERWHFHQNATMLKELVAQLPEELAPSRIRDGLGQVPVAKHSLDAQILHADHLVLDSQIVGEFVQEIPSAVGYLLVGGSQPRSLFASVGASFHLFVEFALFTRESFLARSICSGVGNAVAIAVGVEVLEANVHGLLSTTVGLGFKLFFDAQADVELPVCILGNRGVLDGAVHRWHSTKAHHSNLGQLHGIPFNDDAWCATLADLVARAIGLTPTFGMELWIPRPTSKVVLIRAVQVAQRLLKRHAVAVTQPQVVFVVLQGGEHLVCLGVAKRDTILFVCASAFCEEVVVDKASIVKAHLQQTSLLLCWVEPGLAPLLHLHHATFWFSMYCLTIANGAPPTVDTK